MKLLIRQGRFIDPVGGIGGVMDILLEDGRVAVIGSNIDPDGAEIIEAQNLIVSSGLVDMHVHLRDPGYTHKETIETGRAAAAAGGFTAVACMPNTRPVCDDADVVAYILDKAKTPGTRVLPIGALTLNEDGEKLTDPAKLRDAGAVALSDDGMPVQNANVMRDGLMKASRQHLTVLSHCEDKDMVKNYAVNEGQVSRALGIHGRPAIAEELMVMRDAMLAEETGAAVHICHVSTAKSAAIIRNYKHKGVPITCETCPQYFTLTEEEVQKQGTMARVNPPLRTKADVEGIIAALRDGTIDAIATDHAPHSVEEKARGLTEAPSGMVGLETSLALALTGLYHTGLLSLNRMLALMSASPAALLGLDKGTLVPGRDADLVLFDPNQEWVIDKEQFVSKGRNTPFHGRTVRGKVKYTISRGNIIYQEG